MLAKIYNSDTGYTAYLSITKRLQVRKFGFREVVIRNKRRVEFQ